MMYWLKQILLMPPLLIGQFWGLAVLGMLKLIEKQVGIWSIYETEQLNIRKKAQEDYIAQAAYREEQNRVLSIRSSILQSEYKPSKMFNFVNKLVTRSSDGMVFNVTVPELIPFYKGDMEMAYFTQSFEGKFFLGYDYYWLRLNQLISPWAFTKDELSKRIELFGNVVSDEVEMTSDEYLNKKIPENLITSKEWNVDFSLMKIKFLRKAMPDEALNKLALPENSIDYKYSNYIIDGALFMYVSQFKFDQSYNQAALDSLIFNAQWELKLVDGVNKFTRKSDFEEIWIEKIHC